jgi:crotonobetainyl-CoA:carnitine CoA-transferase CaiB-like acyl-CoA transferase
MTLADLRKELKDLRKKAMPTPVSRMKKGDVAAELDKLKGLHSKEVEAVKEVLTESKAPKKAVKKVEAVQKKEHAKQEEVVKKTKGVKSTAEVKIPMVKEEKPKAAKSDAPKGSDAMKEKMAKLRAMRKAKKDSEEA